MELLSKNEEYLVNSFDSKEKFLIKGKRHKSKQKCPQCNNNLSYFITIDKRTVYYYCTVEETWIDKEFEE